MSIEFHVKIEPFEHTRAEIEREIYTGQITKDYKELPIEIVSPIELAHKEIEKETDTERITNNQKDLKTVENTSSPIQPPRDDLVSTFDYFVRFSEELGVQDVSGLIAAWLWDSFNNRVKDIEIGSQKLTADDNTKDFDIDELNRAVNEEITKHIKKKSLGVKIEAQIKYLERKQRKTWVPIVIGIFLLIFNVYEIFNPSIITVEGYLVYLIEVSVVCLIMGFILKIYFSQKKKGLVRKLD